jgi:hypothetical protein
MMSEFERIEDGRLLKAYINSFGQFLSNMDTMLGNVNAFIAKYPGDAAEVQGYMASAKSQIQAILNKY